MPDSSHLLAFVLAALVLTLSPGPDNLLVLSLGVSRGRRAGMVFGLGCALGCLSHTALAVLGVSALLASTPWALSALKLVGGSYLMWLGLQAWRHAGTATVKLDAGASGAAPEGLWRLFGRGLLANVVNPKVVLFFLSFLPQFVQVGGPPVASQLAWLGAVFTLQAAVVFGALGWGAGALGSWLTRRPGVGRWLDRAAGTVFIGLGARLVVVR